MMPRRGFPKIIIIVIALFVIIAGARVFVSNKSSMQNTQKTPSQIVEQKESPGIYERRTVTYGGVSVDVLVGEIPATDTVDVLLAYHGTAMEDSKILEAAETTLEKVGDIIERKDIVVISVLYPEEGLLFGDNIREAEAALLWAQNGAAEELGMRIGNIYLIGHSQGGYIVSRLNTMHETDGVIANGAGPIDLAYRCRLEVEGKIRLRTASGMSPVCELLEGQYGSVLSNPAPYTARSLTSFTSSHKSKILFVQGMQDKEVQMALWPEFKSDLEACVDCADVEFFEVLNAGHTALFTDKRAQRAVNDLLKK